MPILHRFCPVRILSVYKGKLGHVGCFEKFTVRNPHECLSKRIHHPNTGEQVRGLQMHSKC